MLKNFADQTGVTYEFVKRKVRRLVVEKPVVATPMNEKKLAIHSITSQPMSSTLPNQCMLIERAITVPRATSPHVT